MNLDRIPSFRGEINRIESKRTPVYESKDTATYVREYDIFGKNKHYLKYIDRNAPERQQLEQFAVYLKNTWERVRSFIPVPPFQVVVGKLSTGQEGVYVIVETVFESKGETNLEQKKKTFADLLHAYGVYVRESVKQKLPTWQDFTFLNVKYGHTTSSVEDFWYIVDLDPMTYQGLTPETLKDICDDLAYTTPFGFSSEDIEKTIQGSI